MELRTLRYLVSVIDTGSVTAAALQVRIAQPSISRQLRQLERELGLTLFERERGRLILSPAGRRFMPIARDLVARADAALAAASAFAAGQLDRISIAAPPTTVTDVVAPFVATLRPTDPFPSILLQADPRSVYAVLAQQADLAISTEPPPAQLAKRLVATLPIWLYVRGDHPWATRDRVELEELAQQELLVLPNTFKPRQVVDAAAARTGVVLATVTETGSGEIAQALTAAGRGLAVVSDDPRFGLIGLRIQLAGNDLTLELHAGWDNGHHAAAAMASLVARLQQFCIERYGLTGGPGLGPANPELARGGPDHSSSR